MGADAAGVLQEAHHGAVWRGKPDSTAATHPCCPGLPVRVSLQTVTSLPLKVLAVLFLTFRRQLSPGQGKPEDVLKPDLHALDFQTPLSWLQKESAAWFDPKSHKDVKSQHQPSEAEAVSSWTQSPQDILTYTSKDSASSCTWSQVLRKHRKLENAALRENYRHNGAITDATETGLLGSVGSVVAHRCPSDIRRHFTLHSRTLELTEWTFRNMEARWRRVRLKPGSGTSRTLFCSIF